MGRVLGCGVLGQMLGWVVSRLGGEYRGVRSFRFGGFFVFSLFFLYSVSIVELTN